MTVATAVGVGTRPAAVSTRRRPYTPVIVTAVVTAILLWIGWRGLSSLSDPGHLVSAEREQLIGPTILVFLAAAVVVERICPAVRRPLLARGHVHDALYAVFYAAAAVPLVALTGAAFGQLLQHVRWLQLPPMTVLPRWSVVVLALLAMDFSNWLAHLANHRIEPLWRLHAVHHTQEELSILTSFRAHPLVHTTFLIATIPVFVLLANGGVPSVLITVYVCLGALPHANVPWRLGPLGWIIVSPAYHRRHHATAGRLDVNLGVVFTIWDVLSRRAIFPTPGAPVIATGLSGRPIVVEQEGPTARHLRRLGAQLVEPFTAHPVESITTRSTSEGASHGA